MKVLFLDIDGVVNCATTTQRHRGFIGIDPHMAFKVGKIVLDTGCEIVLSSSWRHFDKGREEVDKQVYKTIDITPDAPNGFRGDEINMWLKEHPEVTQYAILDDDSDFHPDQPLFKTAWKTGITDSIAAALTKFFNEETNDVNSCDSCKKRLIPDREAFFSDTRAWDGHTWKFPCSCAPSNLRVSVG